MTQIRHSDYINSFTDLTVEIARGSVLFCFVFPFELPFLEGMCGHIACGILVPNQGLDLCPLQWELRILTTGLPVKSLVSYYSHWSLELTVLWSRTALNAPTYLSPLSKVYKCSHLHRWISVSRAHNMGTYTHSHGYSCHLCLNMC